MDDDDDDDENGLCTAHVLMLETLRRTRWSLERRNMFFITVLWVPSDFVSYPKEPPHSLMRFLQRAWSVSRSQIEPKARPSGQNCLDI